jgi:hypothetical protein
MYITNYLSRVQKFSPQCLAMLTDFISGNILYESVHADLLNSLIGNIEEPYKSEISSSVHKMLFGDNPKIQDSSLKMAAIKWVLRHNNLSYFEIESLYASENDWWVLKGIAQELNNDWWVLKGIAQELNPDILGAPNAATILNMLLSSRHDDVARCAAATLIAHGIHTFENNNNINRAARVSLKFLGFVDAVGKRSSMIGRVFSRIFKMEESIFNWQDFLGKNHSHAEQISLYVNQKFEMDLDACIVRLDSLFDIVLAEASSRIIPLVQYSYGSHLNAPPALLRQNLPRTIQALNALHETRLSSITAHPRLRHTGKATRRLLMKDFNRLKPLLSDAIVEIEEFFEPLSRCKEAKSKNARKVVVVMA